MNSLVIIFEIKAQTVAPYNHSLLQAEYCTKSLPTILHCKQNMILSLCLLH